MTFEEFKKDVERNNQKPGTTAYIIIFKKHSINNFGKYLPIEVVNENGCIFICGKSNHVLYDKLVEYLGSFGLKIKEIVRITEEIIELCDS
jgi:hypothetical protein